MLRRTTSEKDVTNVERLEVNCDGGDVSVRATGRYVVTKSSLKGSRSIKVSCGAE